MLRFFRKDYVEQFVVIVLMLVTAWVPAFVNAPRDLYIYGNPAPLYNILASAFSFAPWLMTVLAFVIFSFSVFFFNSILTANQLSVRNSTIGAMTAIVCVSSAAISVESYPFMLACPLILAALQTLYVLFLTEKPESYLFNIGLFLSMASMLYMPSVVLIMWVLLSMMIFGYKQIRLYFIPMLGFVTPYFIMMSVCYFTRDLEEFFALYSNGFLGLEFQRMSLTSQDMIVLAVEFVLFVLSYLVLKSSKSDNSVPMRKRMGVTAVLLLSSLLMMTLQVPVMCNGMIFVALSIYYSMALSALKRSLTADIMIIVMMVGACVVQYLQLL